MARLIDADALKATFQKWANVPEYNEAERHIIRAAMIAVDDCPTIDGWISVKDRLPDEEDYRSCHENWDGCVIWTNGSDIGLGWYSTITGDWADIYDCDIDDVTHWMPLPEPPKEDDDEAD